MLSGLAFDNGLTLFKNPSFYEKTNLEVILNVYVN